MNDGTCADMRGFEINGILSPSPEEYRDIDMLEFRPRTPTAQNRDTRVRLERDDPDPWRSAPPESFFRLTVGERQFIVQAVVEPVRTNTGRVAVRPIAICRRVGDVMSGLAGRPIHTDSDEVWGRVREAGRRNEPLTLTQEQTALMALDLDRLDKTMLSLKASHDDFTDKKIP